MKPLNVSTLSVFSQLMTKEVKVFTDDLEDQITESGMQEPVLKEVLKMWILHLQRQLHDVERGEQR